MKRDWRSWLSRMGGVSPSRKRQLARQRRTQLRLELLEDRRLLVGDITGTVFHDLDANGVDDPADNGLAGWTVFVDTNHDGLRSPGEPTTITDDKGRYAFTGLPAGQTTVYEELQPGFMPTPGFLDHDTIEVRDGRRVRLKFPNVSGAPLTGSVAGTVFQDSNVNGAHDPGEEPLQGWQLFLDVNGDGALSPGEPTALTDSDGGYRFSGVPEGPVTVYELPQAGMQPVVPGLFPLDGATDHQALNVVAGGTSRADFANLFPPVGTIQGTAWDDANGDGLHGATESPLAGRTVYVDLNNNGALDAGEPQRVTGVDGAYAFENIRAASYRVTEMIPDGWMSATGFAASRTVNVFVGSSIVTDFNDFIPVNGAIHGVVFNDLDGDGAISAGEPTLADWQLYLDLNANGTLDAGEPSAVTGPEGSYQFVDLAYGDYRLNEVLPIGWEGWQPTGGRQLVHLLNGEDHVADFANRERIGAVHGTVWNDLNGDSLIGAGDVGVGGRTVFVDLDADGLPGVDEPSALSNPDGTYVLSRVPAGAYSLRQQLAAGWVESIGAAGAVTINVTTGSDQVVDFYTLLPVDGAVSGAVWFDNNANGVRDALEIGVEGMTMFADDNANGVLDAGEASGIVDAAGNYRIEGVSYGAHTIRSVNDIGQPPTNRAGDFASVLVLSGEELVGVDFGYREPTAFTIGGVVFNDTNGNGIRDAGEEGLSGVSLFVDLNDNGVLDAGEPTSVSSIDQFFTPTVDEAGKYTFGLLPSGSYTVREMVPAELEGTAADARSQIVSVGPRSNLHADFANRYRENEIHGVVFDDTDADHIRDAGEYGRPGVTVYIDVDRDNVHDLDEPTAVTGDDGAYHFYGLTPGSYVVRELDEGVGPRTYPLTTDGILWPEGTDNPAIGNVSPTSITTTLADGESFLQTVSLTLPSGGGLTNLVDVFLLFDDTGSFTANSPIVRAAFPDIIATLQAAMPTVDFGFGVGRLEEYGSFAGENATGRPFILNQPIVGSATTGFSTSIQAALDRTAPGFGGDGPETDIEALFQVVTGLGFDGNNNGSVLDSGPAGLASTQILPGTSGDVPSFASFVPDPANNVLAPDGSIGGAGFRAGALPVILTATDTGFAYQPNGETSVTGLNGVTLPLSALTQASRGTTPFSSGAGIQETVTALNALGALVVGLGTNAAATVDPRLGLESLARLTGAVNHSLTTIENGTADPIGPGDPLYFQISSGFGATVANGITNAIQNAVTNVALDITLQASDPNVRIINHTGTLFDVAAGGVATFDVEFIGDGRPHRFDLQFVRAGTNVVVGSIPVTIGTPIAGDGYNYDDLDDGEIHHSSHFGHYVPNVAPSFTVGADQSVTDNAGPQTVAGWATDISAGGVTESGQSLTFEVTTDNPALFATLPAISADGTLTYATVPGQAGAALVTVVLRDDGGQGPSGIDASGPQSFQISVTAVNDAPVANDDTFQTNEGEPLVVLAAGVLANDADPELDPLSAAIVSAPSHGVVTLNSDGSFEYVPVASFVGADSFTYVASDGLLDSNVATVTINVNPILHAPVAGDDDYAIDEDGVLSVPAPGVLSNDSDLDGDALTAVLVSNPANGVLTFGPDGAFEYVPSPNFNGVDSFTYSVTDGGFVSAPATVRITVSPVADAPVAVADAFVVNEDGVLTGSVLGNDSDADGDALAATLVTGPANGTLAFSADGTFVYTPAANFFGADSFVYQVSDGLLVSSLATVAVTVAAVNDAPVATGESYVLSEDSLLTVAAPGLLENDADVDSTLLVAQRVTSPAHGTLTLGSNGLFSYQPFANYHGPDSFTYRVSDGLLTSPVVTVSLQVDAVNDAPVARADVYTVDQDTLLDVTAAGLLANDSDVDGDALTAVLAASPAHGSVVLDANGAFRYQPDAGFFGIDSFTYVATDGILSSAPSTVSVEVLETALGAKFFVADGSGQSSFQYAATGDLVANNALSGNNRKARGIASNADGSIQWVVDGGGEVYVYSSEGALLGQWRVDRVGSPEGITVWGNDLWIVDAGNDNVHRFVGGANLRSGRVEANSTFALNGGNRDATDLVTDGLHIWVVNNTVALDSVFRYTVGGALEGNWALSSTNPSPTGITIDPNDVSHIWTVDSSTDLVYQYDAATARLSGAQEPSTTFALAAANTDPQGIADPLPQPAPTGATAAPLSATTSADAWRRSVDDAMELWEDRSARAMQVDGLNRHTESGDNVAQRSPGNRSRHSVSLEPHHSRRTDDIDRVLAELTFDARSED
ncbi:MAG: tandem-95 repeat protein [Planctomycetales bacterium]|nr:tandem-95 repeat protein [Planctomycetales bacterium]